MLRIEILILTHTLPRSFLGPLFIFFFSSFVGACSSLSSSFLISEDPYTQIRNTVNIKKTVLFCPTLWNVYWYFVVSGESPNKIKLTEIQLRSIKKQIDRVSKKHY